MPKPDFVHFLDVRKEVSSSRYDGYLSFLSTSLPALSEPQLANRCYAHADFNWLEIKDICADAPVDCALPSDPPTFWILINLLGTCTLCLNKSFTIESGTCMSFGSNRPILPLELGVGKHWILLLGTRHPAFAPMVEEYPVLQPLQEIVAGKSPDWFLGETLISPRLRSILESLRRFQYRPFSFPILMTNWHLRLLNYIAQEAKFQTRVKPETSDISNYHKAIKYINAHYTADINLEKIAAEIAVSVRNLTRSFIGRPYTVNGYILHLRLTKARELLSYSSRSIQDIAYSLNFSCPKHFSKAFKLKFLKTPTVYREEMKQESFGLDVAGFGKKMW